MMTQTDFIHALDSHTQHRAHHRRHQALADMLALEAHIQPEARHLVPILGKPGDRTNLDALRSWIARELARLDLSGIDVLDYLYARLAIAVEC